MDLVIKMGQTALVDLAVLAASLGLAVVFAYRTYLSCRVPVSVTLLAGLGLGPATTFMHMCAHLVAISVVNVLRFQRGEFVYDMRFYALLQLGVVMLLLSGLSLRIIRRWATGATELQRPLLALALLQMIFSFPLFPFTPIGVLPGMAATLLVVVLFACRRQLQRVEKSKRAYALI